MRLIDGDALMERLGIAYDCRECDKDKSPYCTWKPDVVDVCQIIADAPTIEERKKGKWIYGENLSNGHDGYFCSECGWFAAVDYDFPINSEENKPTNYCPNCGAMMKGADDGTR